MNGLRIGSLFSGYEGLGMAVQSVLGGDIAWVSDIDPGACKILAHRYPDVPNLGDITRVGHPYSGSTWQLMQEIAAVCPAEYELPAPDWSQVEPVDVLTLGFPCQDLSLAGLRKGLRPGTRSGLWTHAAYAIDQLRPSLVVIENVRGLLSAEAHSDLEPCPWCVGDGGSVPLRALGAVLGDLADIGYDASWQGLRAADVGAPHGRFRVFVTAWTAADADDGEPHQRTRADRPSNQWTDAGRGELRARGRRSDASAQDADLAARRERRLAAPGQEEGGRARANAGGRDRAPAADAHGDGLTLVWREQPGQRDADGRSGADIAWGAYEPAVRRWEALTRPAPSPTEPGKTGARLSPAFVEWMQGLPAGWVTDVPGLTRNEQLKALGNGVVPQQAAQALRMLLPDVRQVAA